MSQNPLIFVQVAISNILNFLNTALGSNPDSHIYVTSFTM